MGKKFALRLCDNKARYSNNRQAHKSLEKLKLSNRDKVPCRVYYCEFCDHWHLTSKSDPWD